MALNGTYGFVYCGFNGLGVGVFTLENGRLAGRDWEGGRYTGSAIETAEGNIVLELGQEVPAGVKLVQGTSPQNVPYGLGLKQEVPPLFGDGAPIEVSAPGGTVRLMVKRIPDEYATRASSQWSRILTPR